MICTIEGCGQPMTRRRNESPARFAKRKTCGSLTCVYALRRANNQQRLPNDNERWWVALTDFPAGISFQDAQIGSEPPLRVARPDQPVRHRGGRVGLADFLALPEAGVNGGM